MRVLQVLPDLSAGGAEAIAVGLGIKLTQLGSEIRFHLMAGARGERGKALLHELKDAGISVSGCEGRNVRSPVNIMQIININNKWKPHIIHAHLYTAEVATALAKMGGRKHNAKYVRTLHNTEICGYRSKTIVKLMDYYYGLSIACSEDVGHAYKRFMNGIYKSKLMVIPNGGILKGNITTIEERNNARKAFNLHEDDFVVCHIGRMYADSIKGDMGSCQKAQDVLIKAFKKAFENEKQCKLILVGEGPLRDDFEMLAKKCGIERQTIFIGQIKHPWPALDAADMFCLPSRHEGLPGVLLEAASCGLPVVASDIAEIRNIAPIKVWHLEPVDNINKYAEAMMYMRKNISLYKRMAREAAIEIRRRFDMAVCASNYLLAYKKLIDNNTVCR
jgi:glycosyltransferase involved in cell wall biosynthesis